MLDETQPASSLQQRCDPYCIRRVSHRYLIWVVLGVPEQVFEDSQVCRTKNPCSDQVGTQFVGPIPMVYGWHPEQAEFVKRVLKGGTSPTAVGYRRQTPSAYHSSDGRADQGDQEIVVSEHEVVCQLMSDPRILEEGDVPKIVSSGEKDQIDYVGSMLT